MLTIAKLETVLSRSHFKNSDLGPLVHHLPMVIYT